LVAIVGVAVVTRPRQQQVVHSTAAGSSSLTAVVVVDAAHPSPTLRGALGDGGVADGGPRTQHGTARRTHRAKAHGPRAINVAWKAEVDGPVAAQVTVSPDESALYVATLGGDLIALNRIDGARLWTMKLGDRGYGAPLVLDDGTIWVGSDAKKLYALTPKGDVFHRIELDGEADSGPVLASDGTIVLAAGSDVLSVRRGGDVAWRFTAKGKVFTAPAVAASGLIVFGSQDHNVYALQSNGQLAWKTSLGADVDGAPAIGDDGAIYVGTDGNELVRLDEKGAVVWRSETGGFVRGGVSIARNSDVLVGTYGPVPHVLRFHSDGTRAGEFAIQGTGAPEFGIHGGPLEDEDGALYFGAQDDAAYAIGLDGALRWRFVTGADIDAPLTMLSDGSLVIPSEDGSVTLLAP
jgi:outer membrane protein assembly factor BamB